MQLSIRDLQAADTTGAMVGHTPGLYATLVRIQTKDNKSTD